tara:strand:- start:92 stop:715 length:624 start_codon:yes stop_codon:yes gene_type:complete
MCGGRRMKHMVDLFSGMGGASEAMAQDEAWNVLRIENNPLLANVPFTVIDDVNNVRANVKSNWLVPKIDLIWASPPCTQFSGGFNSPKSKAARTVGLENYNPDLHLLHAALEIIEKVQPKYWVIENVVGSIRYFKDILGEPRQIIGPYVLWGNFPYLEVDESRLIRKQDKDSSPHPLRSNRRALVDFEVSRALKEAIENQTSIFDFD